MKAPHHSLEGMGFPCERHKRASVFGQNSKKLKSVKRRQKGIFDDGKSFEVKISAFSAFLHSENVEKPQKSPKFGVLRVFD